MARFWHHVANLHYYWKGVVGCRKDHGSIEGIKHPRHIIIPFLGKRWCGQDCVVAVESKFLAFGNIYIYSFLLILHFARPMNMDYNISTKSATSWGKCLMTFTSFSSNKKATKWKASKNYPFIYLSFNLSIYLSITLFAKSTPKKEKKDGELRKGEKKSRKKNPQGKLFPIGRHQRFRSDNQLFTPGVKKV